jgi:hypothetical protein
MDDLDPVARLRLLIEQAAELDTLASIAAALGIATPGVDALLRATIADAEQLATSFGGGGPEAGEA